MDFKIGENIIGTPKIGKMLGLNKSLIFTNFATAIVVAHNVFASFITYRYFGNTKITLLLHIKARDNNDSYLNIWNSDNYKEPSQKMLRF